MREVLPAARRILYEATRAYLMLGQEGPLDLETVKLWFARDWLRAFPGAVNQPVRDALMAHLETTLARNFHRYPVDGALVDASRRIFSRLPLSERVFTRLQAAVASQNIAPWRPADALGAAGQRYFLRASGTALTEGVPGIYTVDGLYRGLLPVLGQTVRQGVAEYWVLGPRAGPMSAAMTRCSWNSRCCGCMRRNMRAPGRGCWMI
jgi:type VI secretion system protein ImpL